MREHIIKRAAPLVAGNVAVAVVNDGPLCWMETVVLVLAF